MPQTPVERCIDLARGDHDRQGGLTVDDLNRITGSAGLSAYQVLAVISALREFGIETEDSVEVVNYAAGTGGNDTLGRMLRSAGRVPLLTAAEEVKLGRRISLGQRAGAEVADELNRKLVEDGKRAHNHLVLANMRLVVSIARRYPSSGMELADVIQEGMIGLMRAADKYDHSLGYKFSTYATWWIRQGISRGLADKSRLIRLPVHFVETLSQLRGTRARLERELNRPPSLHELSDAVQMDPGKVQATLDLSIEPVSLDELFPDSDTELVEVLNLYADDVEDQVVALLTKEGVASALERIEWRLAKSTGAGAEAAKILRLRFGIADGEEWTLDQIGAELGVTRERVRQILKKTLISPLVLEEFSRLAPEIGAA